MEWGEVQEGYQPSADTAKIQHHIYMNLMKNLLHNTTKTINYCYNDYKSYDNGDDSYYAFSSIASARASEGHM